MPSIKDAVGADLSRYGPPQKPERPPVVPQMLTDNKPKANPSIRCPLPPFNSDPDTLRQFETGTTVPQIRVVPLPQAFMSNIAVSTTKVSTSASSSGGGGSSTPVLTPLSAVLNTGPIAAGASVLKTVTMKKSFQLLSISSSAACEVRLYGTAAAQGFDQARVTGSPVPPEISQNIVTDVVFDTKPYTWPFQNRVGANQDSTQGTTMYVTVVNTGTFALSSAVITISYLPLES
jgi:hypothetical protein